MKMGEKPFRDAGQLLLEHIFWAAVLLGLNEFHGILPIWSFDSAGPTLFGLYIALYLTLPILSLPMFLSLLAGVAIRAFLRFRRGAATADSFRRGKRRPLFRAYWRELAMGVSISVAIFVHMRVNLSGLIRPDFLSTALDYLWFSIFWLLIGSGPVLLLVVRQWLAEQGRRAPDPA